MTEQAFTVLRYLGNALLIIGYFVLLYVNMILGLAMCFTANALLFPWAVRGKYWDVVLIAAFFAALNGTKLLMELIN